MLIELDIHIGRSHMAGKKAPVRTSVHLPMRGAHNPFVAPAYQPTPPCRLLIPIPFNISCI